MIIMITIIIIIIIIMNMAMEEYCIYTRIYRIRYRMTVGNFVPRITFVTAGFFLCVALQPAVGSFYILFLFFSLFSPFWFYSSFFRRKKNDNHDDIYILLNSFWMAAETIATKMEWMMMNHCRFCMLHVYKCIRTGGET